MRYSDRVNQSIVAARNLVAPLDLTNRAVLIANLCFVHQFISASERLVDEAAQEATGELRDYYLEHAEEERGHAAWLAADLLTAGADVMKIPKSRTAVAMAGGQYYLMKHVSPAALLGYMAVLEGNPMPMEMIEHLEALHGVDLLRTVRYHAEHDIDHGAYLAQMIDKTKDGIIMESAVQTALYLNEFQRELRL